ncbi:metallophosphoesterase [Moraxella nasovis]|uniref:metallophosphoesterase n=1 Tax=Moraxella nasovis TaxID=2904121 RepID=UPI001F61E862|nr:metallophosphoesterase [Moraxella nasovis]UNU73429.1 metallophosphoesterase [Moraxella nasovis]
MRSLLLPLFFIIMQLLSLILARSLVWFFHPFISVRFWVMAIIMLVISNAFLAGLYFGAFRLTIGYLAVLWLSIISMLIITVVVMLGDKFGFHGTIFYRLFAILSLVGVISLSIYNAYTPVIRHITVTLDKSMSTPVRLALVSDIHLGVLVGKNQLDKLTKILSDNQVDLLLMPGDIMDDDTMYFDSQGMAGSLTKVVHTPRFGTVVSLGNHDLYQQDAYRAITHAILSSGAILLNDEHRTLLISKNGKTTKLNIVGRLDDHYHTRQPTAKLIADIDTHLPTILLDHRPSQIEQNTQLPIDLQVSGHTHKGQVFPANFIVNALNRLGYGYEKINGTHVVVSSGFGFWGVPFRLGSQAEVWIIDMVGKPPIKPS